MVILFQGDALAKNSFRFFLHFCNFKYYLFQNGVSFCTIFCVFCSVFCFFGVVVCLNFYFVLQGLNNYYFIDENAKWGIV
jgi:hypothetical protein